MPHLRWISPSRLSAVAFLSLAACGGGGGGDSAEDGTSQATTADPTVTRSALQACPTGRMSPADPAQLGCLAGRYTGSTTLDTTGHTPARPCTVWVHADGRVTLSDGVMVHAHDLSQGQGTYRPWDTKTSFSEYTGRQGAINDNGEADEGMEAFILGTNGGTVRADGSTVPMQEWNDLQVQYVGAAPGRAGFAIVTFASTNGLDAPRLSCHARL